MCGVKIWEQAETCPHCGFTIGNGLSIVASRQVPKKIPWEKLSDSPFGTIVPFSPVQVNNLNTLFRNGEYLEKIAPSFYETLKAASPHTVKVAELKPDIQRLVDEGKLKFVIDKHGEILPSVSDGQHSRAFVRLKDLQLTPDLAPAIINLQAQASMNQIISELQELENGIHGLRQELQYDRLAKAESAWQQLQQASQISDSRLKEAKLLQITQSATDAKCLLMKAFEEKKHSFFDSRKNQNAIQKAFDVNAQKHGAENSAELLTSLLIIIKSVQVEVVAYVLLGEQNAALTSFSQLRDFISDNALDDPNTLLFLNSYSETDYQGIIDYFSGVNKKISQLPEHIENAQPLLDAFRGEKDESQDE